MNERIKEVRLDERMTQEEFARRICIGKSALSRLESGVNNPSDQTIKLICSEFGINQSWLETGEGPKYPEEIQNGPEALIPDLVGILNSYPAVLNVMQLVVRHMKPSDWERLNQLLDEASAKKDPEA